MSFELKMPPAVSALAGRFDRLSLRERVLVVAAVLAVVITAWNLTLMDSLTARERRLTVEVEELQTQLAATSRATANLIDADPTTRAMTQLKERQVALDAINVRLASESAGLIPASQMVQVIRDVLSHQQGLVLVSLQNLPMTSLAPPVSAQPPSQPQSQPDAEAPPVATTPAAPAADTGPYLHPVELVIDGNYLDIVAYLHALESLPWHFYWRVLELETKTYPRNRVRIELSTVSLEKEWIGV